MCYLLLWFLGWSTKARSSEGWREIIGQWEIFSANGFEYGQIDYYCILRWEEPIGVAI